MLKHNILMNHPSVCQGRKEIVLSINTWLITSYRLKQSVIEGRKQNRDHGNYTRF